LPRDRNLHDPLDCLFQVCHRRGEREAHKISSRGSKGCPWNCCDAGIFQQEPAYIFGARPGTGDVDPSVESAVRGLAFESRNPIQVAHELFSATNKLADHAWSCAVAIKQSVDGGVLSELGYARVAGHGQYDQRGWYVRRGYGITPGPSRHGGSFRETINNQRSLFHAWIAQH